ncbi:MAG: hypothetical protein C0498_01340 [Anaerolinea sp.]|nr:hypothetical protein [Anaerolinea sp.]
MVEPAADAAVIGLRESATLTRKTRAGNASDGSPTFTDTFPWAGRTVRAKVDAERGGSRTRYEPVGPTGEERVTVYLPYLGGALRPVSQDILTVAGTGYLVEAVSADGWRTQLIVTARIIRRGP